MKINLGFPEILLVLSYLFYKVSFTYSVLCFIIAIAAKIIDYALEYSKVAEIQKLVFNSIEKLTQYFENDKQSKKASEDKVLKG